MSVGISSITVWSIVLGVGAECESHPAVEKGLESIEILKSLGLKIIVNEKST